MGHVYTPAAILGTLAACCGQREGTGLGSSCALGTGPGPELHPLPPTVGPCPVKITGQHIPEDLPPAVGDGPSPGSSYALGTGPEIHTLPPTAFPGTASGGFKSWGPRPHPGGDSWHPGGLLQPEGRAPSWGTAAPWAPARKSTRCVLRWALAASPAAPSPGGHAHTPAAILGTLAACYGQREGTSLGNSCAMGTGLKIYTLPPTAGPGTASDSFKPWGQRPALAAILGTLTACCGQREGTGLGSSCALGSASGPEFHTLLHTVCPGTASGGSKPWGTFSPGGDPGHPDGPLRPKRGHRSGKQLRPVHRLGNPHAAPCGGPWHCLRRLRAL